MAKKSARTRKPDSDSDDTERRVSALNAQLKQLRGEPLTRQQERDLAWFEHLERSRHISQWQAAVPKASTAILPAASTS